METLFRKPSYNTVDHGGSGRTRQDYTTPYTLMLRGKEVHCRAEHTHTKKK